MIICFILVTFLKKTKKNNKKNKKKQQRPRLPTQNLPSLLSYLI